MSTSAVKTLAQALVNSRIKNHKLTDTSLLVSSLAQARDKIGFSNDVLLQYEVEMNVLGWKTIGYKVGATNAAAMERFHLKEPFWAPILLDPQAPFAASSSFRPYENEATKCHRFSIKGDMVRGIEAEFAFFMKEDIAARSMEYTKEELLTLCSHVCPAVEICASRIQTPPAPENGGAFVIVDGGGNHSFVFSQHKKFVTPPLHLENERATVKINGKIVANGNGSNVLGSPLASLHWFIDNKVRQGPKLQLKKNQFISTGAICGLINIPSASYVTVDFAKWASVHLCFRE